MTWIQLGLAVFAIWCALNTAHFVMRPLRLRRQWRRDHKGVR